MTRTGILFVFLLGFGRLFAQDGLPPYGKIDKADLEMKDCEFDKGAEAVKLIDWGKLYYDGSNADISRFATIYERRIRIKILKDKGLHFANVNIPYFSHNDKEKIINASAITYNIDAGGHIRAIPAKANSIYNRRISNDLSELIIAMPEVKTGSVIEYRYTLKRASSTDIKDWYFQESIPVRYSEYQVQIPSYLHFIERTAVADKLETSERIIKDAFPISASTASIQVLCKNYIMRNLPGIHDEPYMRAMRDYQQRIAFQLSRLDYGNGNRQDLMNNWDDVIGELKGYEFFGEQLDKQLAQAETLIGQASSITDTLQRMRFITEYLRQNINWNGNLNIYSNQGVVNTLEKKTGNSADINLLLVNLLNHAGVKAIPALFSTRDNGMVSSAYPDPGQFNTVIAYVQLAGNSYLLDATDIYAGEDRVPASILNSKGLLVDDSVAEKWIIATEKKARYKIMSVVSGEIDENDKLLGTALVSCFDYARQERLQAWKNDKKEFKQFYFTGTTSKLQVLDLTVNNTNNDSLPLEQKLRFITDIDKAGDYAYFKLNMFTGIGKNPFVAAERQTDVDFGFQQEFVSFGNFTLPNGYRFAEVPKDISLVMPDNSIVFNRFVTTDDNLLNVRITLDFRHTTYPAGIYPELREFYKQVFEKLDEQVVIKRK